MADPDLDLEKKSDPDPGKKTRIRNTASQKILLYEKMYNWSNKSIKKASENTTVHSVFQSVHNLRRLFGTFQNSWELFQNSFGTCKTFRKLFPKFISNSAGFRQSFKKDLSGKM